MWSRSLLRASSNARRPSKDTVTATNIAADATKPGLVVASPYFRLANEGAFDAAERALDAGNPYISTGLERTGELLEGVVDVAVPLPSGGTQPSEIVVTPFPLERAGETIPEWP